MCAFIQYMVRLSIYRACTGSMPKCKFWAFPILHVHTSLGHFFTLITNMLFTFYIDFLFYIFQRRFIKNWGSFDVESDSGVSLSIGAMYSIWVFYDTLHFKTPSF